MSPTEKNTYEIHTSMAEELILEELRAMKRKFFPVTALTAKHFNLMVLAPPHQSGRRRSGGFVQLDGSVSQQGDDRCIHIKTCSGIGFIIPMSMVMFLFVALILTVLEGNRNAELLFPIGFVFVFSAIMLYMKKSDSKAARQILCEHFEGTDRVTELRYMTRYTPQQCVEFMQHDNENDIYEYEWRQEKTFGALIIKNYKRPDRVHDFHGRQEWGFIVRFCEHPDGGTLIEAKLVQTEKLPYIHNKEKIDIFWKNKLDAIANG